MKMLKKAISVGVLVLALMATNTGVHASTMTMNQLTNTYWNCDAYYMLGKIGPEDMLPCIAVYEEFKQRRFKGDFDQFLQYWRDNRAREWAKRGYKHLE